MTVAAVQPASHGNLGPLSQLVAFAGGLIVAIMAAFGAFTGVDPVSAKWLLALLAAAPLLWFIRARPSVESYDGTNKVDPTKPGPAVDDPPSKAAIPTWTLVFAVGLVSFNACLLAGDEFGDIPPGIHDEYSYLFQAETFLSRQLWFPSHPTMPDLFDQVHVLNEGKFASRYFPGTALWLAPFQAIGKPYWAQWIAGALSSMLVFGIGCEIGGRLCGFVAGMLTALSPGMAIFGNILSANYPTLLGLTAFLFALLRARRSLSGTWAAIAGAALTFAMWCRPLTAAAVAFPFGLWILGSLLNLLREPGSMRAASAGHSLGSVSGSPSSDRRSGAAHPLGLIIALVLPVMGGLAGLFFYNQAITGNGWVSPWSLYNEIYTPRHRYGFDNGRVDELSESPKVMTRYDRWAENLTPRKGLENAGHRLAASWRWILGGVPLTMAGLILLISPGIGRMGWVVLAAIVSLHAAYFPYWLVGLFDWHYVFESLPLWALAFGMATEKLFRSWRASGKHVICGWWLTLGLLTLTTAYVRIASSEPSVFAKGVLTFKTMRMSFAEFGQLVDRHVSRRPALVLVQQPPENIHIDFVVNSPALDRPVLFARYRPEIHDLRSIEAAFPNRELYLYRNHHIERVMPTSAANGGS